MEIRKASMEDCVQLTEIRIAMQRERKPEFDYSEVFYQDTLSYFKENIANDCFAAYLAIEGGKIVATSGICFYMVPPTWDTKNGKVAYIMNMYTIEAYRRQGLAAKLLDKLVQEAREKACTKIMLTASDMGLSLYTKHGFKLVDRNMVYLL